MSRILCVIDGMTDPHFQVERYGHLASTGSVPIWAAHSLFYQPLNGNSQNMKTA